MIAKTIKQLHTNTSGESSISEVGGDMIARFGFALPSFFAMASLTTISYFFIDKQVASLCKTLDQDIIDIFQVITALGQSEAYLIGFKVFSP